MCDASPGLSRPRASSSDSVSPSIEIHPEPDAAIVHVGAVHVDDVRMSDARETPRFMQDAGGEVALRDFGLQQLERDRVIEPHVVSVEDLAERTRANAPAQNEVPPSANTLSLHHGSRRTDVTNARQLIRVRLGRDLF